ncbi:BRISC and BRCA1-A complex member 1 [Striga asiatica]|uniref:BRISC and BRCA1-A complex member 1 n=1 Tax=Striga asiatica TaxID=4170 RepID=A0A5A7QMM6_STRAF|nr:BRISC and BRCA1-A complex member 1 [Striga asiatica]
MVVQGEGYPIFSHAYYKKRRGSSSDFRLFQESKFQDEEKLSLIDATNASSPGNSDVSNPVGHSIAEIDILPKEKSPEPEVPKGCTHSQTVKDRKNLLFLLRNERNLDVSGSSSSNSTIQQSSQQCKTDDSLGLRLDMPHREMDVRKEYSSLSDNSVSTSDTRSLGLQREQISAVNMTEPVKSEPVKENTKPDCSVGSSSSSNVTGLLKLSSVKTEFVNNHRVESALQPSTNPNTLIYSGKSMKPEVRVCQLIQSQFQLETCRLFWNIVKSYHQAALMTKYEGLGSCDASNDDRVGPNGEYNSLNKASEVLEAGLDEKKTINVTPDEQLEDLPAKELSIHGPAELEDTDNYVVKKAFSGEENNNRPCQKRKHLWTTTILPKISNRFAALHGSGSATQEPTIEFLKQGGRISNRFASLTGDWDIPDHEFASEAPYRHVRHKHKHNHASDVEVECNNGYDIQQDNNDNNTPDRRKPKNDEFPYITPYVLEEETLSRRQRESKLPQRKGYSRNHRSKSQTRSPVPWSSPQNNRRSPVFYLNRRMRSPFFRDEIVHRRRGSPFQNRRGSPERAFPRSGRRTDGMDSREMMGDCDEFNERRSFRTGYNNNGNGENFQFHPNEEHHNRPYRFCSDSDGEFVERGGGMRDREFDGRVKNHHHHHHQSLSMSRRIRNVEEHEDGNYRSIERDWHDDGFSDGRGKRRRF